MLVLSVPLLKSRSLVFDDASSMVTLVNRTCDFVLSYMLFKFKSFFPGF